MPVWWHTRTLRQVCRRKVTWSTRRGGCRFDLGHDGACKPVNGRAR